VWRHEPGQVRDSYRRITLSVEDRHWWYVGRRAVVEAALDRAGLPRSVRVLDAGCGGGGNLASLARYGPVTGLEPSTEAASRARARGLGDVVEGTLEQLPFEDGSFDLAVALDVIEHLDDDVAGLVEVRRVVAPGGLLLVTVPAYPRLWSRHDDVNEHRRRYVRRTLLSSALAAGWQPVRTSHFNFLLLPLAGGSRLLERARGSEPEASDFERTPPWLDGPLQLPMRLEARLIRAGVSLPAGLSLLGLFGRGS
jgi:SAM-dependent methyltransferase